MDLTIAALTEGERATLNNILDRGLASLTKASRTPAAVAAVDRLRTVLRETPQLDTYCAHVLMRLAFEPRGLLLLGVNQSVLHSMALTEHVEEVGRAWMITRKGWEQVWNSGTAATILDDRHGITFAAVQA